MVIFKKEIKKLLGTYKKAMITKDFVYYLNFEESDDSSCTIMFDKNSGKLKSENIFATNSFFEDVQNGNYEWLDKDTRHNLKEYFKNIEEVWEDKENLY